MQGGGKGLAVGGSPKPQQPPSTATKPTPPEIGECFLLQVCCSPMATGALPYPKCPYMMASITFLHINSVGVLYENQAKITRFSLQKGKRAFFKFGELGGGGLKPWTSMYVQ